jgi:hypothetical protein
MRLQRLEFDVNRQHEGIVDDVMVVPSRNVDILPSEPEHHGRAFGRIVGGVIGFDGLTVTDRSTCLEWEKKTNSAGVNNVNNLYSWSQLIPAPDGTAFTDFLANLNGGATGVGNCESDGSTQMGGFANHCDWRLPTIAELETIADTTVSGCGSGSPCIDPTFGPTDTALYWSASTAAADMKFAFTVDFSDGSATSLAKVSGAGRRARAVRGGS